jgi:ubiquinone biosynthesis protein
MIGTQVSQVDALRAQGVDIPELARERRGDLLPAGFPRRLFHADMHPGNILVDAQGRYIALDFGIMGTLNDADKNYLAQNFLAFFRRDYRRVAQAHPGSRLVPPTPASTNSRTPSGGLRTGIRQAAARDLSSVACCCACSRTSRRFNVEIQPQLVLLQKTLLNIEGWAAIWIPTSISGSPRSPTSSAGCPEQIGWRRWCARCARRRRIGA